MNENETNTINLKVWADSLLKENDQLKIDNLSLEQESAELRAELSAKGKQKQPFIKLTLTSDNGQAHGPGPFFLKPGTGLTRVSTSKEGSGSIILLESGIAWSVQESPAEVLAAFGIPVE